MKALIKTKTGPEGLKYQEIKKPEIGDNDLLIEVKAAGICGSDVRLKKLGNSKALIPPVVIGHEFAGKICEKGKNVTQFRLNERVVSDNSGYLCGTCRYCATGNFLMCQDRKGLGFGLDGGFTKYVKITGDLLAINPNTLFRIPDHVSYEEAVFMDPLANAYKAIVQESSLKAGDDIVIYGLGTIGLLAVRVAKIMGARRIIAIMRNRNANKSKIAENYGATNILYSNSENIPDSVHKITNGADIPVVVDCAGTNSIFEQSLQFLRKGGEFIKIGYDPKPLGLSLDDLVIKGIKLIGHFAYNYESWIQCMGFLESSMIDVKPLISCRLPLDEWQKGFKIAESKDGIKVILIPE